MYAIQYFNSSVGEYMVDIYPTIDAANEGHRKLRDSSYASEIHTKKKIAFAAGQLNNMFMLTESDYKKRR